MRYFLRKAPGEKKAENYAQDIRNTADARQAIENLMNNPEIAIVYFVSEHYEADNAPTVRAKPIEWTEGEHPGGELWIGSLGGRPVARVLHRPGLASAMFRLEMRPFGGEWRDCRNVSSGQRAAQRALNKVLQTLADTPDADSR
jgi:hypothetical protein